MNIALSIAQDIVLLVVLATGTLAGLAAIWMPERLIKTIELLWS